MGGAMSVEIPKPDLSAIDVKAIAQSLIEMGPINEFKEDFLKEAKALKKDDSEAKPLAFEAYKKSKKSSKKFKEASKCVAEKIPKEIIVEAVKAGADKSDQVQKLPESLRSKAIDKAVDAAIKALAEQILKMISVRWAKKDVLGKDDDGFEDVPADDGNKN